MAEEAVTAEQAAELVADGALLIDVREDDEWEAGHAPQAVHLPMSRFTREVAAQLPFDKPIVCVCHLGVRSAAVANALADGGWQAVNLIGGMDAWEAAGLPVE